MPDLETLWQYLCDEFKKSLSELSFNTWIGSAKPVQFTDQTFVIEVPSQLHRDYWSNNLLAPASAILEQVLAAQALPTTVNVLIKLKNEANPLSDAQATSPTPGQAETKMFHHDSQLNENYTFDRFIVGKGNQLAHAAALAVSEEPGGLYNPLFFYGGVGLGKTHLMHAIGHQVLQTNPTAKIKYVTSEAFANDFIKSIQNKRQEEFRQEYRNVDVLLVDDIQFFADKVGTQEEFFHTFNTLYDNKKQIVLSADRLPNEISKLQARLVSRFEWGLPVDITPPDYETRIAILRNKAKAENMSIPNDTFSYVAGQFDSNIRELEGALVRVQAYANMMNQPVSTSLAAEALRNLKGNNKTNLLSISIIQDYVAKYFHLTVKDLKGRKRVKQIVVPRQIAMYLSRELTDASLPKIGEEFGGKDHTTVIHAHTKIAEQLATDRDLQKQIQELKAQLKD
ncbi:chromosomal replication initiator protein DnaA [Ligilactobacillus ceti]|uniref:Chromosomal replication initiator protein DnaA n=1 Tax=Ligilactobacillus ceti DSM 22408 TaxID=1122146 RepID=A0A0R2KJE3_9LACO|nr:chromosomal replication initiator protein DnaA [Ligilactobacillus ceti]KRN89307.1 chromosomal replication initiation protein [Ligilactobacillus ceti DSM 22408]